MVFVVCCLTVVSKTSNDNNAPLKKMKVYLMDKRLHLLK